MAIPALIRLGSRSSKQSLLRTAGGLPLGLTRSQPATNLFSSRSISTRLVAPRVHAVPLLYGTRSFSSSLPSRSASRSDPSPPSSFATESQEFVSSATEASSAASAVPPLDATSIPTVDASVTDAINAVVATGDRLGDFAAVGLGGWGPTGLIQSLLEHIHLITGLPWWGSIVVLTAMVRISMLPIHRRVMANNSRLARVQPEAKVYMEAIKNSQATKNVNELQKNTMLLRQLYADANASPLTAMLGLVQVPVALSMFFALKGVLASPLEGLHHGGIAWFTDLTLADPTFILPVLSTGAFVAMLKLSSADTPKTPETRHMTNGFTLLSLAGLWPMSYLSSGVLVYFVANGVLTGLQTFLFKVPAIRDRLGILPPPPNNGSVPDPTFLETIMAGVNKLRSFNGQKLEQLKARELEKIEADLRRRQREQDTKKRGSQTPTQRLSKPLRIKS